MGGFSTEWEDRPRYVVGGTVLALSSLLAVLAALPQEAAGPSDWSPWPQWRGPARDGISPESSWDPVGTADALWSREIGVGHSSFAVADGVVFALGHVDGRDHLYALDVEDGALHWSKSWPAELLDNSHDGGTLTTPTVADGVVFVTGREGRVGAYDAASGELAWERAVAEELGLVRPTWGFAASPVVEGDVVLVSLGVVVGLDRATGEVLFAGDVHRGSAYSTPTPFVHGGDALLATLTGDGLAVVEDSSGKERAFYRWDATPPVAPMSPVVDEGRIFVSGGYGRGGRLLRFDGGSLELVWSTRKMRNKMSGCVLWNGHLYGFDESILMCMDLEGRELWSKRGLGTGSLSVAGGRLVILDGHGQLVVALATPLDYTELSRRAVFEDGTYWSTPVVSHGRVFCRSSRGLLACLDHRRGPDRATEDGRARNRALAAALLDAEEVLARHAAAVNPNGAQAPRKLRLTGAGTSLRNTERVGPVEVSWSHEDGFAWREPALEESPAFELAHSDSAGWSVGEHLDTRALEGEELAALKEAGDVARLLDPASFYTRRGVVGVTLFDHRSCYVLAAATRDGFARKLYFEVDTGLLAGQEGRGTALWTYDDYRRVGDELLPMRWAFYDPDTGEMTSATFTSVEVDASLSPFEPPPEAQPFLRSAAEIEAAESELHEHFAGILGEWFAEGEHDGEPRRFWIERGFLATSRPQEEGNYWTGPDERGRMALIGAAYLTFEIERDAERTPIAIQVYVNDDPRTRLVRPR